MAAAPTCEGMVGAGTEAYLACIAVPAFIHSCHHAIINHAIMRSSIMQSYNHANLARIFEVP